MSNTGEDPSRSVRVGRYPGGTGVRRFGWLFPAVVVVFGAVATAVIILLLRNYANEKNYQRLLLAQLEAQGHRYSALKWQAISEEGLSSSLREEEQVTDDQLTGLSKQLVQADPNSSATLRVIRAFETYDSAKDEEFRHSKQVKSIRPRP